MNNDRQKINLQVINQAINQTKVLALKAADSIKVDYVISVLRANI